jgi:hypothetical protein
VSNKGRALKKGIALKEGGATKIDEIKGRVLSVDEIYDKIDYLPCLRSMVVYYQRIYKSINHLVGHDAFDSREYFYNISSEHIRRFRRYINSDLNNLSIEFYLQRAQWASECRDKWASEAEHREDAMKTPARHPCLMKGGFRSIAEGREYTYEHFMGETLPIFIAIHNHLVSINRALRDLYRYVTDAPFSSFTPTGKSEILNLTSQLNRIMQGLLVATHLQPQKDDQRDLVSYLISRRADCQHFFETIPLYYQTHRMRLVVSAAPDGAAPEAAWPYELPVTCLPWSAGVYLDFLSAYESIALHVMAVFAWAIRLYSLWHFVPQRYLRLLAPTASAYH